MKRSACILLVICLIVGLFPGVAVIASAEEAVKLQEVVLDFEHPTASAQLPDSFTVNDGFVVDQYSWEIYRDGAWHTLAQEEQQFADDQTYKLRIQLVCAEGYYIDFAGFSSGYMPATINGESAHGTFYGEKDGSHVTKWTGVALETVIFGDAVPAVKSIDLAGIPVQSGDTFTAQQITLGDQHVFIRSCQINVDGEAADQFKLDYGYYNIHIDLSAEAGYVLDPDTITVNGMPIRECGWEVAFGFEVGEGWISLSCEREPEGYVDGVTVSGAPSVIKAGEAISAPKLSVKWSSNGTASVSQVQWLDADHVPVAGNFIAGNVYYLAVTLHTDGETPFRDFFNLEVLNDDDSYHCAAMATASSATTAVAYIRYALLPALENIKIRLPVPAVGEAPGIPEAEDPALVTVSDYSWIDVDNKTAASVFEDGHRYQLKFRIQPAQGYQLQLGTGIYLNGEAVQTVTDPEGQGITVEFSFHTYVERVEIIVEEPSEHAIPGSPSLGQIASATISNAKWIDSQTGNEVERFVPGVRYYLELDIRAASGYTFTNQTEFLLNGRSVKAALSGNSASLRVSFDLVKTLTEIQLSGIPDGILARQETFTPAIGSMDKNLSFGDIIWLDEDREPFSGVFEAGNVYYLSVTVRTSALTPFADRIQVLGENGLLAEAESDDGLTAVFQIRYSLLKTVDRAQISVALPQVGSVPAAPVIGADMPYSILSYSWMDLSEQTQCTVFEHGHRYALTVALCPDDDAEFGDLTVVLNGEEVKLSEQNGAYASFTVEFSFRGVIDRIDLFAPDLAVGKEVNSTDIRVLTEGVTLQSGLWINALTFEELSGKVDKAPYTLRATVRPLDGYEFSDSVQIYLNGQELSDVTISSNSVSCAVDFDLRDSISDIQIFDMPQISIGGSTASVTMGVPDGAPYSVQANWLLYGGDYQFAGPGPSFEDGKVYYLEILVKPNAGYRIAEDVKIQVDGAVFTGICMTGDIGIWLYKQYNCGLQVIDRVDLTVTPPAVGQLPGVITVGADACVSLRDFTWAYSLTGAFEDAVDLLDGDIFESGYYYMISGSLVADPGYVFAENLTITVNGIPSNIDLGDLGVINLGDTAFLGHSFGLLQQDQAPAPTGDMIGTVLVLMLSSAAAWLALKRKK